MMTEDQVEMLVLEAHRIFWKTSIFDVLDVEDRLSAMMTLVDLYGPTRKDDLERYLAILDRIRKDEEGDSQRRK